MKLYILDSKGIREHIDLSGYHSKVKEIKNKMLEKNLVKSTEIMLHFNGLILEDDYSLEDLDIEEGSTLVYLGYFIEK